MRDDCIELSNLTSESLTLRRQILETREFRRRERENHVALKQQYEQEMNINSNGLKQVISSNTEFLKRSLNDIMITTSSQSSSNCCIGMTQLKHYDYNDEIIRTMRNQEILDTYTRVVCRQNIQQIEEMKTFISKERMKLNQTKNRLNSVRKELITTQPNVQEQHSFDQLSEDVFNYHYPSLLEQQQQQQSRRTMKKEYNNNDYYDTTTDDSTISTNSPTAVQNFPLSSCTTENERNRFHNNTHSNQKRRKTRSKRKKRIHSFSSRKSNLLKTEQ